MPVEALSPDVLKDKRIHFIKSLGGLHNIRKSGKKIEIKRFNLNF